MTERPPARGPACARPRVVIGRRPLAGWPSVLSIGPLRATRFSWDDLDDLVRMNSDPEVMATLGGLRDRERTAAYLESNLGHWDREGFGLYALRGAQGAFAGRAGLRRTIVLGREEIEVAYALMSPYWGRGLALAVTLELVAQATAHRLAESLVAFTLTTNERSRRVMDKAGFTFESEFDHGPTGPHVLYRRLLVR